MFSPLRKPCCSPSKRKYPNGVPPCFRPANLVLRALKEDNRHRQPINVIDRRAIDISLMFLRVRSDQPIQIMTLEFVRIARERNKVAHAVIACSRAKRNLMLRCKGAQRGIATSAAATNHQTVRVGIATRCQVASPADAVLNVENAPLPLQPKPVRTAISRAPAVVHIRKPCSEDGYIWAYSWQ
jgi:hypothetical protein